MKKHLRKYSKNQTSNVSTISNKRQLRKSDLLNKNQIQKLNPINKETNIPKKHSHYLNKNLSRYNHFKFEYLYNFELTKDNLKTRIKKHWCLFLVIIILILNIGVHTGTQVYVKNIQNKTDVLIEQITETNDRIETLKKENEALMKQKEALNESNNVLENKIKVNEEALNEYINKVNELNQIINSRTTWSIPTVSLTVPINDSYFKTYMDYRKITSRSSAQWKILHSDKVRYDDDGLIRSVDGDYIGVALGSKYGVVGDKFILTLQTNNGSTHEVKLLKVEEKADKDTTNGYYASHRDLVEFVIDVDKAKSSFPTAIRMGDFNYSDAFNGKIVGIRQVVE